METYTGYWFVAGFFAAFVITSTIVLLIRSLGNKKHSRGVQREAFLSGNPEVEYPNLIRSGDLYWGFNKSLSCYYRLMRKMHNGVISEYVFWFYVLLIGVLIFTIFGGV